MPRHLTQEQKDRGYILKKNKRAAKRNAAKRRDEFNKLISWSPPPCAFTRYVEF